MPRRRRRRCRRMPCGQLPARRDAIRRDSRWRSAAASPGSTSSQSESLPSKGSYIGPTSLAGRAPAEPDAFDLGQVPDQPEQGQIRRGPRPGRQLFAAQAGTDVQQGGALPGQEPSRIGRSAPVSGPSTGSGVGAVHITTGSWPSDEIVPECSLRSAGRFRVGQGQCLPTGRWRAAGNRGRT